MEGEKNKRAQGLWKESDDAGRPRSMLDEGWAEGGDQLLESGGIEVVGVFVVVVQSLSLCSPINCSMPSSSVLHYLLSLLKFMSTESVMLPNHLILCYPLLLLPLVFPSIRVFFNELVLHIRWPKYWTFSFSISPSKEYSEFLFFRMDWFDLLAVQRTLKSSP